MAGSPVIERVARDSYAGFPSEDNSTRASTLDGVILKTLGLFGIALAVAIPSWIIAPDFGGVLPMGAIAITIVLGLIIAFKKTISVPIILAYAVVEGVLLGSVSRFYSLRFDEVLEGSASSPFKGIVAQAILATICVFGAMLFLYATRIVKVTQRFRSLVSMAVLGYALFALVNFGYAVITNTTFGIGGSGPWGVLISVVAIGLASLMLMIDFDSIEKAVSNRAPEKVEWILAHGLLVTLVWLYLEILRLLGRLRE